MTNKQERVSYLKEIKTSPFTVKMAKDVGLSFYDLQVLVDLNKLEKIGRGIYSKITRATKEDDNQELKTSLIQIGEPSCICLLSALYLYGITDEIPNQTWVYVPYEKTTRLSTIKTIRKRNFDWSIGVENFRGLRITSIERTLIDCLVDKKHFTQLDSIKYAKVALRENLTDIKKLLIMAKKLNVDHQVKMILTMLQENYV